MMGGRQQGPYPRPEKAPRRYTPRLCGEGLIQRDRAGQRPPKGRRRGCGRREWLFSKNKAQDAEGGKTGRASLPRGGVMWYTEKNGRCAAGAGRKRKRRRDEERT